MAVFTTKYKREFGLKMISFPLFVLVIGAIILILIYNVKVLICIIGWVRGIEPFLLMLSWTFPPTFYGFEGLFMFNYLNTWIL